MTTFNLYPYNSSIILTDLIFSRFGGDATKGTPEQRKIAYLIAEEAASEDIGTLLLPTIVTGTFFYNPLHFITLDYGYVHKINSIAFIDIEYILALE